MRHNKLFRMLFLLFFIAALQLSAQEVVRYQAIGGVQKNALPKGTVAFNVSGQFPTFQKIYNAKINRMIDLPASFVITEAYLNTSAVYGYSNNLSFFAKIPFEWINHYSPDLIQQNKGFGDFELGGYYRLIGNNGLKESTALFRLSVIAPIGENKNLAKTDYPLGEGAWQFSAGFSGSIPTENFNLIYSANYILKTENGANVNLGDELNAYVSLEKDLNTSYGNFTLESGLIAANQFVSSVGGAAVKNSSSAFAQIFAGLAFYYRTDLRFSVHTPVTFYRKNAWFTDYGFVLKVEYSLTLNN